MAGYPSVEDLISFLGDHGIESPPRVEYSLKYAIGSFEVDTGWIPFAASNTPSSRYYDPPELGTLDLKTGFARIDEVRVGISQGQPDGVLLDTSMYDLLDYGGNERPYVRIVFDSPYSFGAGRKSIKVTGLIGYCIDLPDDVHEALLCMAGSSILPSVQGAGDPSTIQQGPIRYDYGGRSRQEMWIERYNRAVARYARATI